CKEQTKEPISSRGLTASTKKPITKHLAKTKRKRRNKKENKENRKEIGTKQLKRVTNGSDLKGKGKVKESLVESIKKNNVLEIRIACHNINELKSNRLKLEALIEDEIEDALDSIWEVLEKSILETAMKHILKKKICKTRATRDGKKRPKLDKLIVELDR
ncbi:10924_t:CDS:2, partial [Gigaspora margarita]